MIYDSQLGAASSRLFSTQLLPPSVDLEEPDILAGFNLQDGVAGDFYNVDVSAYNAGGAADSWAWNGTPPPWANLNASTGVITGTATEGSWSGYSVTATNAVGSSTSNVDSVIISEGQAEPDLSIAFNLSDSIEGTVYNVDLNTLNTGSLADSWAWNGTPPPWASLDTATGIITGTATLGSWSGYSVTATNSTGSSTSNMDSVTITEALPVGTLATVVSNLAIVSKNLAKEAVLSASSEAGSMIVGNLQNDSKTEIWRSVGTSASITMIGDSSGISAVALCIASLTSTATMRVCVYTLEGDAVPAYDTGNILCCEYTTIDKIDFSNGALNSNTFNYGGGTYASLFFNEVVGEKVVIQVTDTNNSNGYIEASVLVVGKFWTPKYNAAYGASLSLLDTSKHTRNAAGGLMTVRGAIYKRLGFLLSNMMVADRTALFEILIRSGMSVPLFISFFPGSDEVQEQQIYQIYGKLTRMSALTRFAPGLDKSAIQIEEI